MRSSARGLALLAAGLVLMVLVGAELACHAPGTIDLNENGRLPVFVGLEALGALVYFAAVALVRSGPLPRRAVWMVLGLAALMRVVPLTAPPFLSSDLFRYVWDGRVQAQGINPYRYLPAAPELAFLRDADIYEHTNRSEEAPTIYPPAAQLIFAAIGRVWSSVYAVKAVMVLFEAMAIGIVAVLLRQAGLPGAQVLIYAWNPLPVWELRREWACRRAVSIGFARFGAGWRAVRGRRGRLGRLLRWGLAVLVKFLPAAIVHRHLYRRWGWRMPAACGRPDLIAALYAMPTARAG